MLYNKLYPYGISGQLFCVPLVPWSCSCSAGRYEVWTVDWQPVMHALYRVCSEEELLSFIYSLLYCILRAVFQLGLLTSVYFQISSSIGKFEFFQCLLQPMGGRWMDGRTLNAVIHCCRAATQMHVVPGYFYTDSKKTPHFVSIVRVLMLVKQRTRSQSNHLPPVTVKVKWKCWMSANRILILFSNFEFKLRLTSLVPVVICLLLYTMASFCS